MARGRPIPVIDLEQEVKKQLKSIARSRSLPHGLVRRANIVLLAAEGFNNKTIANKIGLSAAVVGMWRKRFLEQGLMGLYEETKPGGPRSISDEQVARLIRKTLNKKPKDGTHWTCRSIAKETKLSKSTVHRVWNVFGIQHHRQKHFKLSNDPFFEDLDIHLVVDNYSTHKHEKVRRWIAARPRYHVHYTPTYTSWLNQVEIWFNIITQQAIRRGTFRSVKDLIDKIKGFVDQYNKNSKPFMWTATADSILAKIERLCKGIAGTIH